ncbi:MAG TPA: CocE/NonD family hydrolase [Gemmatimonadales bacterium]|nr:CocE/NonD family hydrolase [Gemmatimonadales bacterium]
MGILSARCRPWLLAMCCAACGPDPFTTQVVVLGQPRFRGSQTTSLYLPMSDGIRIAVEVSVPTPLPADTGLPALLEMTRYWRAREGEGLSYRAGEALRRGFAVITIDERGTGASFGTWPHPWSARSLTDFAEVVDWVVAQPWSNGRVGAAGISYPGMAAQLLAGELHPAVRVVIPASTQWDLYREIGFPGGILLEWFLKTWSDLVRQLDRNQWPAGIPGVPSGAYQVKRVAADTTGALLAQAVAGHASNGDVYQEFRNVVYRDDPGGSGIRLDQLSPHARRDRLATSGVAIYSSGSWLDHGTADAVIRRFVALPNLHRALIGAWSHGLDRQSSPFGAPGDAVPDYATQWGESLIYAAGHLTPGAAPDGRRLLRYYTMGEEAWKVTATWPVSGTEYQRWFLGADHSLVRTAPTGAQGQDRYLVDFSATTGDRSRWHTPLTGAAVEYPDRADQDGKLLVYQSGPLASDLEITGYPVVTLHLTSTHADGAFFVYLEAVDSSGGVRYVTEGQFRALHRKVAGTDPSESVEVPWHSFTRADGEPLVPGQVATLEFALHPTSVLIRRGHRLRVAIAGHDAGAFLRIPAAGDPEVRIERNSVYPSGIVLPVVP